MLQERHEQQGRKAEALKTQRDELDAERHALAEQVRTQSAELQSVQAALHSLHERYAEQGKAASQLQAQRDALEMERRTLHETLQALRTEHAAQGREAEAFKIQRDEFDAERRTLGVQIRTQSAELQSVQAALHSLQERHAEQGKAASQLQAQRDALETERRSLHEALQALRTEHAAQGREAEAFKIQRDEFDAERRTLGVQIRTQSAELQSVQAALHSLQERHADQEKVASQLQTQRDTLETERRSLHETLHTLRKEHADQSKAATQLQAQRDALETERRTLHETLQSLQERHTQQKHEAERLNTLRKKEAERHATSLGGLSAQLSALQQEVVRYRSALVEAEKRADATKQTLSFRLGYALTHNTKSWDGFSKLPGILLEIRRDAKKRRKGHTSEFLEPRTHWLTQLETLFAQQGLAAAEGFARAQGTAQPTELATGLTRLARLELRSNANEAVRLARESVLFDPRPFRRKWLAFLLFDAGHITEAHELLLSLPHDEKLKPSERFKAEFIAGCQRLLIGEVKIPEASSMPAYQVESNRVLYVASSSLPYHVTGYTSRTHGIVQAIRAQGWDVTCVTRPGYPDDRPDAHGQTSETVRVVDGIRYELLPGPYRRKTPLDQYLLEAAEIIANKAREERPALIHAASNYEAAIPALIAARTLGIPFVYEVRGLWEYTAGSKIPGWEDTERFTLDRQLETLAATGANHVFTLTQALADELHVRGVSRARIELAPNAIDPEAFSPIERDIPLAESLGVSQAQIVIGYIGSIVAYEGLDDLVTAFDHVVKKVPGAKLIFVGDGDAMPSLRTHVKALGLEAEVVFAGKVQPDQVRRYFSLLDVVALPRKPFKVCQLVSPLKPLEAMAMGIPLVVSDVAALKEMVRENETALVHKAGDAASLAACLVRLAQDRGLAQRMAQRARREVLATGTWERVASHISQSYAAITGGTGKPAVDEINVMKNPVIEFKPPQADERAAQPASVDIGNPAVHAASEKMKPVIEFKAPQADEGAVQPVDLDIVPLPVGRNSMTTEEKTLFDEKLDCAIKTGGVPALEALLEKQVAGHSLKFVAFCQLKAASAALANGHVADATQMADIALKNDPVAATVRAAARVYYNAVLLDRANQLVDRLESIQKPVSDGDRKFIDDVRGRTQLVAWATEPAAPRSLPVFKGRVLNVLAFSLPYTSVGYATRSHGLAIGIKHAGWDIRPYTRPGFPYDFKTELEGQTLPGQDDIDGITYRRMFDIERRGMNEVEYLQAAISCLTRVIEEEQPEVVHAASNYVTALPALIAARRLGVPFVYEMRGFWEVTRSSRDETFENTPKYRFMQQFEGLVARHADHVITITTAMKEELLTRGVHAGKISIAFNSVDPTRFVPRAPNKALAERLGIPDGVPVIGYVGSFVDYEGLDDLITAAAGLTQAGHDFRLLLVGDGAVFESLREQVHRLGLQDKTILTGRVPHEEVEDYYSLVDIAPFPRKPWEVCELVSPLKPFEAMAQEKAVVVSSTRALIEIVDHERNGLVFEKGNVESLRHVLDVLIRHPEMRMSIGKTAREWIVRERSWNVAGQAVVKCYRRVCLRTDAMEKAS